MKKYICTPLLLASFGAFAQSTNHSVLQKSMKMWQPLSISDSGVMLPIVRSPLQDSIHVQQTSLSL